MLSQITPKTEGSVTSGVDSIFTDEESYEIDRLLNDLGLFDCFFHAQFHFKFYCNFIFDIYNFVTYV